MGLEENVSHQPEVVPMKMSKSKTVLALAAAGLMAFAPGAFAYGPHGGYYRGGYHGGYGGYHGGYYRGGHGGYWSGGRWIGGAIIAGVVGGAIYSATRPAPVYYDSPVVYTRPATVVYEDQPVVRRTVTTTTYEDGYGTRYVRDDGY
jgi:hypothetical protein